MTDKVLKPTLSMLHSRPWYLQDCNLDRPSKPFGIPSKTKNLEALGRVSSESLLHNHRQLAIPGSHQLIHQSDRGSETYIIGEGIAKARSLTLAGEEVLRKAVSS
jgi:hypothetical protein